MSSVLITSANRGLGFEFARQYAADGWDVWAACRKPEDATELVQLGKAARCLRVLAMDVTDPESITRAAVRINEPIDVLLNSAGIIGGPQTVGAMDYESWETVLKVNTMGPLRVIEAFLDHVSRSQRKLIVTITSGMGSLTDNTSGGSIAYRTSKAAVNMLMRSLAVDLAPRGIACVLLNPGWVKTAMGGAGAPLSPTESVTAQRRLIDRFGSADTGKFYSYDGREYPW